MRRKGADGRELGLTPVREIEHYAVIIRCIHSRGPDQQDALAELERRGLWLTREQREQAGIVAWGSSRSST